MQGLRFTTTATSIWAFVFTATSQHYPEEFRATFWSKMDGVLTMACLWGYECQTHVSLRKKGGGFMEP